MCRAIRFSVTALVLAAGVLLHPPAALCQAPPAEQKGNEKSQAESRALYLSITDVFQSPNVPLLSEQRKNMEREIAALQVQIETEARSASVTRQRANSRKQYNEIQLSDIEQQMKFAKDPARLKELERRRGEANTQLEIAKTELARAEQLDQSVEANRILVVRRKSEIFEIERKIDEAINIHLRILSYRIMLSGVFAALIFALMWAFFKVTQQDATVRQAVFSAQSGIQFLTLFCLVIAIFIFGIAGILEGKELSALLGGLSGYILGRVTQSGGAPAATPPRTLAELAAQAKG